MAGGPKSQNQSSWLDMRPQDAAGLQSAQNDYQGMIGNFGQQANQAAGQINTNFAGPNFSNTLDRFSQGQLAQGQQDIGNKVGAQQNALSNQFRMGDGAKQVLAQQAGNAGILAGNGLPFQAALAQRSREGQEYQLGQQAQSLGNQAVTNKLQVQGAPLQQQQNLMSVLAGLAQQFGKQQGVGQTPRSGMDKVLDPLNIFN